MKNTRSILAQLLVVFMLGCNIQDLDFDNIQAPEIDGVYAAPLGELTYTMSELLDEIGDQSAELLEDPETGVLYLEYRDSASFNTSSDLININDVSNSASFELPATAPLGTPQTVTIDTSFTFDYEPDQNERIDLLEYITGTINLTVSTSLALNINYSVTIENTTLNSIPVTLSGTVSNGNSPQISSQDLANHETVLDFQGGLNIFSVDINLVIPLAAGEGIGGGESFDFQVDYIDQTFSLVQGQFGQDTVNVGNTILDIPFFSDLEGEGLKLGSPTIQFDFANSFGLPIGILFGGMYSIDNNNGTNDTIFLNGSVTETPQIVAGADVPGNTQETTLTINKSNSSLAELLAVSPDQIGFDLQAVTNPDDDTQTNFMQDNSSIETSILVTMPLAIQLEDLTREISFDLGGGLDFSEADSAVLRIVTYNGLPFSGEMDVEVYNANDSLLFIAAENLVLQTPFIGNDGIVTQIRSITADIPIGPSGIAAFKNGSSLNLRITLNTPASLSANDIFVKIRNIDSLHVKVSAVAAVKYQIEK